MIGGEFRSGHEAGVLRRTLRNGNTANFSYADVGGVAIFEGDIMLGTIGAERIQGVRRGVGVSDVGALWPGRVIPFAIDPALPSPERALDAVAHWREGTPLKFVERTPENELGYDDFVVFVPGKGCASPVGRQRAGGQPVTLGPDCHLGNAIHEIGHAVGLWHEQSREDRAQFVRIRPENILDGYAHNFRQHISDGDDIGAYDFGSIMHYPPLAFASGDQPTIEPVTAVPPGIVMGQRDALSDGDVAAIAALYRAESP